MIQGSSGANKKRLGFTVTDKSRVSQVEADHEEEDREDQSGNSGEIGASSTKPFDRKKNKMGSGPSDFNSEEYLDEALALSFKPAHVRLLSQMRDGGKIKLKDSEGRLWHAMRKGDKVHFHEPKSDSRQKLSISSEEKVEESAPPEREDQVRALKKKFPKNTAFAIAWSQYRKKQAREEVALEGRQSGARMKYGSFRGSLLVSDIDKNYGKRDPFPMPAEYRKKEAERNDREKKEKEKVKSEERLDEISSAKLLRYAKKNAADQERLLRRTRDLDRSIEQSDNAAATFQSEPAKRGARAAADRYKSQKNDSLSKKESRRTYLNKALSRLLSSETGYAPGAVSRVIAEMSDREIERLAPLVEGRITEVYVSSKADRSRAKRLRRLLYHVDSHLAARQKGIESRLRAGYSTNDVASEMGIHPSIVKSTASSLEKRT